MVIKSPDGFQKRNLDDNYELLVIVEGEKDYISMQSIRGGAITSTTGAKSFPDVREIVKYKRILICYDNDEAGIDGAEKLAYELCINKAQNVYIAEWQNMDEGADVSSSTEIEIKDAIANCTKYDLREKLDIFQLDSFLERDEEEQEIMVDKIMTRGSYYNRWIRWCR